MSGVTVAVVLDDGSTFYTSGTVDDVDVCIQSGTALRCWWVASNGQRRVEDFRFMSDRVHYVRTESEDQ